MLAGDRDCGAERLRVEEEKRAERLKLLEEERAERRRSNLSTPHCNSQAIHQKSQILMCLMRLLNTSTP